MITHPIYLDNLFGIKSLELSTQIFNKSGIKIDLAIHNFFLKKHTEENYDPIFTKGLTYCDEKDVPIFANFEMNFDSVDLDAEENKFAIFDNIRIMSDLFLENQTANRIIEQKGDSNED